MPIKPPPFQQHCPACGWTGKVIAPKSDAFSPADMVQMCESCPSCGKHDLEIKKSVATLWGQLRQIIGGREN